MIQICSVKTNEIIAPENTIQWYDYSNHYMFVEALGKVDIKWRKKGEHLYPGDIAIGKRFHLVNHSQSPEAVRGFMFEWNSSIQDHMQEPSILRQQSPFTIEIAAAVSLLFTKNNCSLTTLMETGQRCQLLFHSLFTKQDKSSSIATAAPTGRIDPRLLTVNRYIREHYMLPLTLQTLADLIQCNPVYLSNTYAKVFRISPIKYLQQLKMSKAQDWLLNTNWDISDIANRLGYVSSSQFTELFKRYYGETPTKYRHMQLTQLTKY